MNIIGALISRERRFELPKRFLSSCKQRIVANSESSVLMCVVFNPEKETPVVHIWLMNLTIIAKGASVRFTPYPL